LDQKRRIWGHFRRIKKNNNRLSVIMKSRMQKHNIRMAKECLETNKSFAQIARDYGVTRAHVGQNFKRFCKQFMFDHERLDASGNVKDLNGLRRAWRMSLRC
jgi:predicted DNA-binding protein YlxM (UPF0122 family)